MNKKLLLSTAALLAGMSLASAQQHMPGGQTSSQSTQSQSSQAQQGAQEHSRQGEQSRQGQAQRNESRGQRDLTTGQGSQGSQGSQAQQGSQSHRAQGAQPGREQTTGQSMEQRNAQPQSGNQGRQLGQSGREHQNQPAQTQGQASPSQQGQSLQPQHSQPQQSQAQPTQPRQGQAQQSQPQSGQLQQGQTQPQQSPGVTTGQSGRIGAQQTQAAGGVTLTNEQRMRIRETVLARSDVPRVEVNRIDFALAVGTIVPTYVHVVEVPDTLITIHPEWRGDMYFVAGDDVIILDRDRHIVATLPVGSSTRSTMVNERGSSTAMHLSRDEILQVQIMLNQKGFNVGEPDGVFGQRTRTALLEFQRNQGLQASGQIDQHTMAALGISGTVRQQGNQQPSTTGQTGQSGPGMNQPSTNQGAATGQPNAQGNAASQGLQNQNSTATQGRGTTSTTGQGNPPAQQPAAPNATGNSSMPQRQSK